jgi:hypothetical protein
VVRPRATLRVLARLVGTYIASAPPVDRETRLHLHVLLHYQFREPVRSHLIHPTSLAIVVETEVADFVALALKKAVQTRDALNYFH